MEKIIETFDKLNQKAATLEETMKIIPHRIELKDKIAELREKDEEIKNLQKMMAASIEEHQKVIKSQYKETTETISRVQMKMMLLMQRMDNSKIPAKSGQPGPSKTALSLLSMDNNQVRTPSRMTLAEYSKSPLAKQKRKTQLNFTDFEAEISVEDFEKIPSYMKGRTTLSDLQNFLENVVIRTFNEKYQIMLKKRSALMTSEINLQSMFKDQASNFEGEKFITVGDIARILEKNVDKKDDRFLQMLRHIQIIREMRKSSIVAYIWLKKF
jgi:hypothetical protein